MKRTRKVRLAVAAAMVVTGCLGGAGFAVAADSDPAPAPVLTEVPGAEPHDVEPGEVIQDGVPVGTPEGGDTAVTSVSR
ncbi:hypothetical protein ABT121_32265 [Streptomyces sp. NPDC001928]|uniref:hypothetical protein n=1 Tax=Streptomyces sp. NPDC001928 TaxID=3154404 RepID=UPI00332F5DAD